MDLEQFYNGNEWYAYQYFGAHVTSGGVLFRVYAPRAKRVVLIGSFNDWLGEEMDCGGRGGIYSLMVKGAREGDMYKFRIYHHDGTVMDKADPYGYSMELRPCSASVVAVLPEGIFTDGAWMENRTKRYNEPMHIYELHFGSWKANGDHWYRYEELSGELIPYLKEMGFNYVELMPLNEHPLDESWGYQSTGFFAPTSRYGTPAGLKKFVNDCHRAGIGVILDFVMVHFATDDYGLSRFDGDVLYELPFEDVEFSEWGSCNFAHGRGEVASYLKSCANYWLSEYHFDGLRMDAVSNIIYWRGREQEGINQEALWFIQSLNHGLHNIHPDVVLIAEDSTNYLKVTAPVAYGGLGFDYKWDLGFMHDTLRFFGYPLEERKNHYGDIWFSMHYFSNELYMLAFSHDEVVHGKKTILDKMYGNYEEKFHQCRALFAYMICHPGKKLNFMGNEIGQFREWAQYRPQDFDVLKEFPMHQAFVRCFRDLNHIYRGHPALYVEEYNKHCFSYVEANAGERLVYAFTREAGGERILAVFNFGDRSYDSYALKMQGNHVLRELINTDWEIYGGVTHTLAEDIRMSSGRCFLRLAPYNGRIFVIE